MKPLISITMSTFNVDLFIQDSLKCILMQTLANIEVICIDDASTDKTASMLQEIASKDNRVKLVLKSKNEGLSVARNEALAMATGKYICFVDGDDLMDKDLFLKAYSLAEETSSEMVLWDYVTFWEESEIESKKTEPCLLSSISKKDTVALLERPAFTWVKLIKTETIRELNIQFAKGLTKQDIPVHWILTTKIKNIAILPERLIYYRQQPNATSYKTDRRLFDIAIIMDIVKKDLVANKRYEVYKDVFLKQQLKLLSIMHDCIENAYKKEALEMIKERVGEDQINYIYSKKPLLFESRIFHKALLGSIFYKVYLKVLLTARLLYRKIFK